MGMFAVASEQVGVTKWGLSESGVCLKRSGSKGIFYKFVAKASPTTLTRCTESLVETAGIKETEDQVLRVTLSFKMLFKDL